jgi:predicted RNase H-like HicB family nuclease
MNIKHYTYRVSWSPEDGEHVALCAEFPSLSWLAKTPEAALRGIQKVVADAVTDMQASGEAGAPTVYLQRVS